MRDVPGCMELDTASNLLQCAAEHLDMMFSYTNTEIFQTNTRIALRGHRDARIADHGTLVSKNADESATHSHMASW